MPPKATRRFDNTIARLTYDADDRIRFLSAAESMALTASKIGETVRRLRGGAVLTALAVDQCPD